MAPDKTTDEDVQTKKIPTDINILLLGETGVGKSTFINSLFNYLQYEDFDVAEKSELKVLIPSLFSVYDKDNKLQSVTVGRSDDANELLQVGVSATKGVRTYTFLIKNGDVQVRLIDTPGLGDTAGIEQDNLICENILSYIGRLHQLHAICYLCKPQETRASVYFRYCMVQMMSRLHADACKNFVFVFTCAKGSGYTPGDALSTLQKVTDEIKEQPVNAQLNLSGNMFCFDNEAFRYLAAVKQDVEFTAEQKTEFVKSWEKSRSECWRMLEYIRTTLAPHDMRNTSAINEARIIYQLSQPKADIVQLIKDNIRLLQRRHASIDTNRNNVKELMKILFIPYISLGVTNLSQSATVCANKCSEVYKVGDKNQWYYKNRCYEPCNLTNVTKELLGDPRLMSYTAMDGTDIHTTEQIIEIAEKFMSNIMERQRQYQQELEIIIKNNAKFAYYLQKNAISTFSDSFIHYIEYLIYMEPVMRLDPDRRTLGNLETLLSQHEQQKTLFEEAAKAHTTMSIVDTITTEDIYQTLRLELNGRKIEELFQSQKKALSTENEFTEYKHEVPFQQSPCKKSDPEETHFQSNPTTKFQRGRPEHRRGRGGQTRRNEAWRPRRNSLPLIYSASEGRRYNDRRHYDRLHNYPANRPPYDHDASTYSGYHVSPPPDYRGYSPPPPNNPSYNSHFPRRNDRRYYDRPHNYAANRPPTYSGYHVSPPPDYRGYSPPPPNNPHFPRRNEAWRPRRSSLPLIYSANEERRYNEHRHYDRPHNYAANRPPYDRDAPTYSGYHVSPPPDYRGYSSPPPNNPHFPRRNEAWRPRRNSLPLIYSDEERRYNDRRHYDRLHNYAANRPPYDRDAPTYSGYHVSPPPDYRGYSPPPPNNPS